MILLVYREKCLNFRHFSRPTLKIKLKFFLILPISYLSVEFR